MRGNRLLLFFLSLFATTLAFGQNASLYGKITTGDDRPVALVNVVLVNTAYGAATNDNGEYRIQHVRPGSYTLQVSFGSTVRHEQTVTLSAGSSSEYNFTINEASRQLEEVVLETGKIMHRPSASATKIPLNALETPQIVHSISSVMLRKQNALTLEDAMKNAPGVVKLWDATSRPDGGSIFVSRGFQTTTKVRNGLPNIVNTNVEMANLERIEVIKGPSATLFGSIVASYGGLINRVTKKPSFYNGGYADVSVGSYNFYRASADVNFVLQKDKMAGRINIAGQNQDSWQDAGFQKTYVIAPSFLYQPNDRFTLNVDAEIAGSKGNSNGGNFMFVLAPGTTNGALSGLLQASGLPQPQITAIMANAPQTFRQAFGTNRVDELKTSYDRSFLSNDIYTSVQSNAFFADASYKLSSRWTSQTVATYSNSNNSGYSAYQYLLPNYAATFIRSMLTTGTPDFGVPGHDSLGRMVWNPDGTTNTVNIQQNFVADYQFGKIRNRTVLGVDYAHYKSYVVYKRFMGTLFGVAPYPDLFDVVSIDGKSPKMDDLNKENMLQAFANRQPSALTYDQRYGIWSGYVNNVTNLTGELIFSAGVRVDNYKNELLNQSQTKWSPKFGLIYMPVKNQLTFFANYQNAFTNKFGTDKDNNPFVPEEAYQTEVGAKFSLYKNKLAGSVSYYDILAKNIIRTDISNPLFNIQDGEQKSKGVEAELIANPVVGWTLLFGYGYNNSKYVKAEADVEGLRPVGSGPENTFNFWTNYSFTQSVLKGFGIGLSVNYAGESYAFNQRPDGQLILPSYTVVGAHLTYDQKRYRLGLKVNNITDEQYWMGWNNYIPQMRRQLIGTVAVKF